MKERSGSGYVLSGTIIAFFEFQDLSVNINQLFKASLAKAFLILGWVSAGLILKEFAEEKLITEM